MIISTTNKDIEQKNQEGVFSSTNGDIDLENCKGVFTSTNGDVNLLDCNGQCSTTNGEIIAVNHIGSLRTTNGDITITNSNIDEVETTNGTITLNNSTIKECTGYNLKGYGKIEHLTLPTRNVVVKNNFDLFNPLTWFNKQTICSNSSINIQSNGSISITNVNGKTYVNGKEINEEETDATWTVPKGIIIKRITTKMTVISKYNIEIDGGGKLQKKVAFI